MTKYFTTEYTKIPKKPLSKEAQRYKKHHYPLFDALEDGKLAVFKELVKDDSKSVQAKDDGDQPILYEVFMADNLEMARILLKHGADPNVKLTFLTPPDSLVIQAIACSKMGFIELFIQYGADVDREEDGVSARKILDNPEQYVKKLFEWEASPGAQCFLAKAQEMKQLIEKLKPRSLPPPEIVMMPARPLPISSAPIGFASQLRKRNLLPPLESTGHSPPSSNSPK